MDSDISSLYEKLNLKEDTERYPAFQQLCLLSEYKVSWTYEVWDQLVEKMSSPNSYQRSIGAILLCNLSQSDPQGRMNNSLEKLLSLSKDEKFITSRLVLQNLWKPAWFEPALREHIVAHLIARFGECANEAHPNLLRQDILQTLFTLAELTHDEALQQEALRLVESEPDPKNKKSYRALMKKK